jgi:hypothetical protein
MCSPFVSLPLPTGKKNLEENQEQRENKEERHKYLTVPPYVVNRQANT